MGLFPNNEIEHVFNKEILNFNSLFALNFSICSYFWSQFDIKITQRATQILVLYTCGTREMQEKDHFLRPNMILENHNCGLKGACFQEKGSFFYFY